MGRVGGATARQPYQRCATPRSQMNSKAPRPAIGAPSSRVGTWHMRAILDIGNVFQPWFTESLGHVHSSVTRFFGPADAAEVAANEMTRHHTSSTSRCTRRPGRRKSMGDSCNADVRNSASHFAAMVEFQNSQEREGFPFDLDCAGKYGSCPGSSAYPWS